MVIRSITSILVLTSTLNIAEASKTGVSIEHLSSKYDSKITELSLDHIVLKPLESAKEQIITQNEGSALGIKVDHWVRPYLNVFGSIAQTDGELTVKFSNIPNVSLPDMKVSNDGMLYSTGVTGMKKNKAYFASMTYIHSIAKFDNNNEKTTANTYIPTIGKVTKAGVFNIGLQYQQIDGKYHGVLALPTLGNVNADVTTENDDKLAYTLGYQASISKNIHLQTSAIFGEREAYKLGLNYRF